VAVIHHASICVRDMDVSLRFWHDGLGFDVLLDERFEGDWPTLLRGPSRSLRAVFLGRSLDDGGGLVELVDLGGVPDRPAPRGEPATPGFLVLSLMTDLAATLDRLRALGFAAEPRRIEVSGVGLAVVTDPDGVLVELVDDAAAANLDSLAGGSGRP
jgi:glyoxylase I family protein